MFCSCIQCILTFPCRACRHRLLVRQPSCCSTLRGALRSTFSVHSSKDPAGSSAARARNSIRVGCGLIHDHLPRLARAHLGPENIDVEAVGCVSPRPRDTALVRLPEGCARPNDLLGIRLTIYRAHWDLTRPGICTKPCQKTTRQENFSPKMLEDPL